jgi:stearoyl-CoA desaturase (Delta-9 desaturase)
VIEKKVTPPLGFVNRIEKIANRYIFEEIHVACLAAIFTGIDARALQLAVILYLLRMFFITGFYHRYFSHRSYHTSRWFQAVMAFLGTSAIQRGPLTWAYIHRQHHKHSDQPGDPHSPILSGFWYSHVGWFHNNDKSEEIDYAEIPDLAKYPELRWINNYHWVAPLLLAVVCSLYLGWQGLIIGFCWSSVAVWHATFCINSLAHVYGSRRYNTDDHSRNNWWLAILTLGEGWHNNHHHYQSSTHQGFFWWEVDLSYYLLRLLALLGLVRGLRPVPPHVLEK